MAIAAAVLLGGHWPAASLLIASAQPPTWFPPVNISVVWPHDAQGNPTSVAQSQFVNVSVWPSGEVSCSTDVTATDVTATGAAGMRLYAAKNSDPVQTFRPETPGALVLRTVNGVTFPSIEFDDIPTDLAKDPFAQFRFTTMAGNVWVHAADARTFLPNPVAPTGYAAVQPGDVLDLRIQSVWPHDAQGNFAPVDLAPLVNVAVDLFAHGTLDSVPVDFEPYHGFAPSLTMAQGETTSSNRPGFRPKRSRTQLARRLTLAGCLTTCPCSRDGSTTSSPLYQRT